MRHQMRCVKVYEDGVELWQCEACEKMIMINWGECASLRTVFDGEPGAIHTGYKAGGAVDLRIKDFEVIEEIE